MDRNHNEPAKIVAEEYYLQEPLPAVDAFVLRGRRITLVSVPEGIQQAVSDPLRFIPLRSVTLLSYTVRVIPSFGEDAPEFDPKAFELSPIETTETSDPGANDLHAEAKDLYLTANKIYRDKPDHKYPYIQINSGLRSTELQAKLYVAFIHSQYGGPAAPRANKPGASHHEYGLAIDVIRELDEDRLRAALTAAGWTADIVDEGWHFDAAGITSWKKLQGKIAEIRRELSDPFGQEVASQFEYEKLIQENTPKYDLEKQRLEREQGRLLREQERLRVEESRLGREQEALNREIEAVNREREELQALQRRIENFRYTYCPNGQVFDDCTHVDLKRRYVDERNRMVNEYNRRAGDLRARTKVLNERIERFKRDGRTFNESNVRFRQDSEAFRKNVEALDKLGRRLQDWADRRARILAERPAKIAAIAQAVKEVRDGVPKEEAQKRGARRLHGRGNARFQTDPTKKLA